MPKLTRSDLHYTYEWTTSEGDNPHLIHDDAKHLSRNEGYEMLSYLNNLGQNPEGSRFVYNSGRDLDKNLRLYL